MRGHSDCLDWDCFLFLLVCGWLTSLAWRPLSPSSPSLNLLSLPLALSPCSRMLPFAQTPARQRNAVLALGSTNKRTGVAPAGVYYCPSVPHESVTNMSALYLRWPFPSSALMKQMRYKRLLCFGCVHQALSRSPVWTNQSLLGGRKINK